MFSEGITASLDAGVAANYCGAEAKIFLQRSKHKIFKLQDQQVCGNW